MPAKVLPSSKIIEGSECFGRAGARNTETDIQRIREFQDHFRCCSYRTLNADDALAKQTPKTWEMPSKVPHALKEYFQYYFVRLPIPIMLRQNKHPIEDGNQSTPPSSEKKASHKKLRLEAQDFLFLCQNLTAQFLNEIAAWCLR